MLFERRSLASAKNFLQQYLSLQAKRKRLLKKARPSPLRDFLAVPFPPLEQLLYDTQILSVDFETTGFNAHRDQILSIGFTHLQRGQISLAHNYHQIINTKGLLSAENVTVHSITDQHKTTGISLARGGRRLVGSAGGEGNVGALRANRADLFTASLLPAVRFSASISDDRYLSHRQKAQR